jgi:hypothetical protein
MFLIINKGKDSTSPLPLSTSVEGSYLRVNCLTRNAQTPLVLSV